MVEKVLPEVMVEKVLPEVMVEKVETSDFFFLPATRVIILTQKSVTKLVWSCTSYHLQVGGTQLKLSAMVVRIGNHKLTLHFLTAGKWATFGFCWH